MGVVDGMGQEWRQHTEVTHGLRLNRGNNATVMTNSLGSIVVLVNEAQQDVSGCCRDCRDMTEGDGQASCVQSRDDITSLDWLCIRSEGRRRRLHVREESPMSNEWWQGWPRDDGLATHVCAACTGTRQWCKINIRVFNQNLILIILINFYLNLNRLVQIDPNRIIPLKYILIYFKILKITNKILYIYTYLIIYGWLYYFFSYRVKLNQFFNLIFIILNITLHKLLEQNQILFRVGNVEMSKNVHIFSNSRIGSKSFICLCSFLM